MAGGMGWDGMGWAWGLACGMGLGPGSVWDGRLGPGVVDTER